VLWIVVLVKLVTPGFVTIDAIPSPAEAAAAMTAPIALPATFVAAPTETPAAARAVHWTSIAFGVWLAGSVLFLAVATARVRRFLRALRVAVPADPILIESVAQLARRIGVGCPRLRVVDAAVSPMVWGGFDGATLILPLKLMRELDGVERDTLLAHELAHLKRGDCWVRWIELAVTAALWWNPVVWWVRRNLRRAEEQACDRWVLELLPRAGRAYADGIVKTVEFIAGHHRTPALATGATGTRQIEERLTMILDPSRPARLRRPLLPALVLALFALPVIPGFAERADSGDDDGAKAELHELERQALDLERRLYEIQRKREEVERKLELGRFERESAEMRRRIDGLRAQGMHAEVAELEAEIERADKRRSEDAAQVHHQALRQYDRELRDREMAMREAEIAYEKAQQLQALAWEREGARVDRALAEKDKIKRQLAEIDRALADTKDKGTRAELEAKFEKLTLELERLEARLEAGQVR
jgi:beta-lactamase regulating signal transducer with metallopeptidase domain